MLIQRTADKFFGALDRLEYGRFRLITPDGQTRAFEGRKPGPESTLEIREWGVLRNLALRGDSGFAEDYRHGLWDTNNLQDLLALALKNDHIMRPFMFGGMLSQLTSRLSYLLRVNTLGGSKRNIHAHYDLGNKFYDLWLDPTMSYSSALFKTPQDSLEQAQQNKYDRILSRLSGTSGKMLEIGCGWGGFADRATAQGDFDLKAITISDAQHKFTHNRLKNRATIALEDYRLQTGTYDHIVSIEMFEAVGERYWQTYLTRVRDMLAHNGRAMIQTITIGDKYFARYRRGGDVIRNYIFPGGMLPSPSRLQQEIKTAGLAIHDQFSFGHDYARTLEIWLNNFDNQADTVRTLGFDDKFIRLWRFYLAACIAGFRTNRIDVMQVDLRHA